MPRKYIPTTSSFPYHITARTVNREHFKIPLEDVWSILNDYLYFLKKAYEFNIHQFVLMPNHFHLNISAPLLNLSEGMNYFMRETSKHLGREANRINQVYGGRFHRCLIDNPIYYLHAYKYVYRNPVEAKLITRVEDYPYSTLSGLIGNSKLIIPIQYDDTLFSNFEKTLDWLNSKPQDAHREAVRLALKKSRFSFAKDKISKRPHSLESSLY